MAAGGHANETDVLINLQQVLPNEEKGSHDGSEEEAWEKALSVERFGDIIAKPVAANVEKMGRSYGERDFEYHRHTFHHTHHPLSTHLPPPTRVRKRALGTDRRRKKKRKKKRTSVPPSEVTPTIHEVDEEEESDAEGRGQVSRPTERADCDIESRGEQHFALPLPLASFHIESECPPLAEDVPAYMILEERDEASQEASSRFSSTPEPPSALTRAWFRRKSIHRLAGAQRASYDLRERICIGSMTTAGGGAVYHKVPTDEAEAQMLASADLDDMKSKNLFRHMLEPDGAWHRSIPSVL